MRLPLKAHLLLLTLGFGVLALGSIIRNELNDAKLLALQRQINEDRNKVTVLTQLISGLKELR